MIQIHTIYKSIFLENMLHDWMLSPSEIVILVAFMAYTVQV